MAGRRRGDPAPGDPIPATSAYALVAEANGNCVDARAAATANGTVIQQYSCNGTAAQRFTFPATDGGHVRIAADGDGRQVVDVANVSLAEQAPLQLWTYGGGANQQWKPVREASGAYHFIARHSGKCLSAPAVRGHGRPTVPAVLRRHGCAEFPPRHTGLIAGVWTGVFTPSAPPLSDRQ